MIPAATSGESVLASIPRESGDDPDSFALELVGDWYSPRERG